VALEKLPVFIRNNKINNKYNYYIVEHNRNVYIWMIIDSRLYSFFPYNIDTVATMVKVYIHFEEDGHPEKTSKLSVPKSWVANKQVQDVIELFIDAYNKVNPDHALVKEDVHLQTKEGMKIHSDAKIEGNLEDLFDYFVKRGVHVQKKAVTTGPDENAGKVRCKNYGCNKYYNEELEGSEATACKHHTGPPIFHDTIKYWSCCPERKAYDWDDFQKLEGCATGCHSTVDPKVQLGRADDGEANAAPVTVLKSISDYNTSNPDASTAAASAVKTLATRKSSRKPDGTAQCRHQGCNQPFTFANNTTGQPCRFHKGQAVFHDAIKYWSCCADKKCYDFDSFMAVPGCMKGLHDDGEIDLDTLNASYVPA